LPRDAGAEIGLVLVVGVDDLDARLPSTVPPKSSAAICAATTEPGPPRSA
jgi:hypothetical protein